MTFLQILQYSEKKTLTFEKELLLIKVEFQVFEFLLSYSHPKTT